MHVQKKKVAFLQLDVSSDWRKPAVNGYRQKKKKNCVNRLLCLLYTFMDQCIK